MRNAAKVLILVLGTVALGACHKGAEQNQATTQDMSIDDNLVNGDAGENADIETLPADESSTTSNGELNEGQDAPDVSTTGNGD